MAKTLLDNIIESIKGIDGRLVNQSGTTKQMIADLNYKVVAPAKSAADSAVSAADAAVASAQVTSDTVSAIASAQAEAMQGANEAMSRALSAWDVATGAKSAVTDFDPLLKSARSDAGKALTQIADTANALSDAKTAFGSDVAAAKELASTAQTTANSAIKSAASVASDLTAVASQAKSNANGITKVTSDVGLLQTTVADNSGNISTIQETATKIQQAVSDNSGNITTAKQTADSAVTVASDARSNATVAIQTASQASITASSASGQAASAVITANGAVTTASDAKSDATVAVQTASGASLTATNAQSDATIAKQTASEAIVQASNADSDFAQISIRANKIEANVATNSGAIASVKQTADGLTTTVADIKANGGGVNLLTGTQEFQGDWENFPLWESEETYTGLVVRKRSIAWDGLGQYYDADPNTTYTFSFYAKASEAGNYLEIFTLDKEDWSSPVVWPPVFANRAITTDWQRYSVTFTTKGSGKIFPSVCLNKDGITVYVAGYMLEKGTVAHTWSPAPEDLQAQFTQIKQSVNGIATTINDPKTGLNATYQTAAGNSSTISSVKGDVTQLQTTANGLTIKVGDLESKTDKQQTAIDQNKNAITLKADQTTVNALKGTVDQNTATLKTQAGQIQSKVSASDVTGMLNGYATQQYTESLVTQTADQWNVNLTTLKTDVNAIKTTGGGVNLANGTSSKDQSSGDSSQTTGWATPIVASFDNPQVGQQYTVSVNAKFNGGPWRIEVWDGADPTHCSHLLFGNSFSTNGQKQTATFAWPSGMDKYLIVICSNGGHGGQITWNSAMLEEGTVAHTWAPAPSDMATVTSVANLSATVNGIQSQVYNSDGSSKITQLSNLIAAKVSQDDYNSQITILKNDINQRVQVGNVISQINQEAGGNTLIQVSNGKGSLILDAGNTVFTGKAWIPVAAIANLTADQVQAGTLSGSKVHAGDNSGNGIDMGVIDTNYVGFHTYANNGDNTYIDYNGIHNYGASYDTRIQQGKVTTDYLAVNGGGMIDFRDSNGTGMIAEGSTLKFDVRNISAGYLSCGGAPLADWPSGSVGNELKIMYGGSLAIAASSDTNSRALFSTVNTQIGYYQQGDTSANWGLTGLKIDNTDRQINLGVYGSNGKWSRLLVDPDSVELNANDTHCHLDDGWKLHFYRDNDNNSATAVELQVDGWAWVRGYVETMGTTQHSTLSSKTRIEQADPEHMLDLINQTELTTFAYKSELADGTDHRHIGPIIDDINDVAQYQIPSEFVAPTKTARDDGNIVGALIGAVQSLTKRIKTLEEKTK